MKNQVPDSTAKITEKENSDAESAAKVLPTVIFAMGKKDLKSKIEKAFHESGMTAQVLNSADEIMAAIERPEVFAIFIDVDHDRNITMMFPNLVAGSRLKWMLLSPPLSLTKSRSYFNMGFADVLFHPVHPVLMQSRARLMLSRYVKDQDFPAHVVLPPGLSIKELRSKSSSLSDSEEESRLITIKGEQAENSDTFIRGDEAQENGIKTIHSDTTKENDDRVHIRADEPAADWNHRKSDSEKTVVTVLRPILGVSAEPNLHATPVLPQTSLKKYQTAELRRLAEKLRAHVQILEVASKNSAHYPHLRIPNEANPNSIYDKGFEICRDEVRNLLIDCKNQIRAANIVLLSFTPNSDDERYRLISTADPMPQKGLNLPEWLLPEIALALEKHGPILIDKEHYTSQLWQNTVGADWKKIVASEKPLTLSVLPIFRKLTVTKPAPLVCLLILFSETLGMPDRGSLEEIMGVLSIPYHHYSHVDFLNRVYKANT